MTSHAEYLRNCIKNHSHYGPCLNGSKYSYFCSKSNQLDKCIDCYKKATRLKEEIIEENNKLKIKEKEANKTREISDREYETMKENFSLEENNEKIYNENYIKNLEDKKKNSKTNAENKVKRLEKEIDNLKEIIEKLKSENIKEEEWKREEILNELQHEYELKVQQYQYEKEYERIKKEEKIKEMENKYRLDKEVEFTELKKGSELVDFLINKMNNFNNFNINN